MLPQLPTTSVSFEHIPFVKLSSLLMRFASKMRERFAEPASAVSIKDISDLFASSALPVNILSGIFVPPRAGTLSTALSTSHSSP